jgi:hypothetical protein
MAVGYGFPIDFMEQLDLPQINALVESVHRQKASDRADFVTDVLVGAQCLPKNASEHISDLHTQAGMKAATKNDGKAFRSANPRGI